MISARGQGDSPATKSFRPQSLVDELRKYTRQRRGRIFRNFIQKAPRPLKIIDLGGTVRFWENFGLSEDDGLSITLVNTFEVDKVGKDQVNRFSCVEDWRVDALTLKEADFRNFDLIFSNSFLEHLASRASQSVMADAIKSSNLPYFIQVPNKKSPIDPHFPHPCVPFFALYPRQIQARLLTIGEFGGGWKAASMEEALTGLKYYNPLGLEDMRRLFPGAEFHVERPVGVPMSILAMNRGSLVPKMTI